MQTQDLSIDGRSQVLQINVDSRLEGMLRLPLSLGTSQNLTCIRGYCNWKALSPRYWSLTFAYRTSSLFRLGTGDKPNPSQLQRACQLTVP